MKEKIPEIDRKKIKEKTDEVLRWLEGNQGAELQEFQAKQKELEAVAHPIFTEMYKKMGGQGIPNMNGNPTKGPSGLDDPD